MRSPRSRLVWKVGGLFWRLALYLVGTTQLPSALLDTAPGAVLRYVTETAYEETLTDAEMDLFMGVFRVESRTFSFHIHCVFLLIPDLQ